MGRSGKQHGLLLTLCWFQRKEGMVCGSQGAQGLVIHAGGALQYPAVRSGASRAA